MQDLQHISHQTSKGKGKVRLSPPGERLCIASCMVDVLKQLDWPFQYFIHLISMHSVTDFSKYTDY